MTFGDGPDDLVDRHCLDLWWRDARRGLGEPRIAGAVVPHDQRGGDGVVALAPHHGLDRHHLADHGLGREPATGHHRRDVIDLDTTGHHQLLTLARPGGHAL